MISNSDGRRVICLNQKKISEKTNYCSYFDLWVTPGCCQECIDAKTKVES